MIRSHCLARAFALAAFVVTGAAYATPPAEHAAQRKQAEARIGQVEDRLAALSPDGRNAERLAARAKTFVDLSRRFLAADDLDGARIHADLAERLTTLAEGKGARQ